MTALSAFVATGRAISRFVQQLVADRTEFTCGQCDRNASCGLPPSQECVYRLMQVAERRPRAARWPAVPFGMD
jgi:hypothetical protein